MKFDLFKPVIAFFPVLLLQMFVGPFISINEIAPDFVLILLVFYTLKHGQLYGTVLGFSFGFLIDLITGSILGSTMFAKTLVGFIAGYFFNENKIELHYKSISFPLIVLLCSLIDSIMTALITSFDLNVNLVSLFFYSGILPSLFTAFFSLLITVFYPKRSYI